ncbi:13136_t:CDS:2, partial [Dentiscutata heterogama]
MEKQLAEQEGHVLQSDNEYNYEIINNPLKPRTKRWKCQKLRMASFNISNESINVDSTEGTEEQDQMMHEHIQDVQSQDQ